MKKIIVLAIVVLMVAFAAGRVYSTPSWGIPSFAPKTQVITYVVTVHMFADADLCNQYAIILRNANGGFVAPPQAYQHGKSIYIFTEKGPVYSRRVSNFVVVPYQNDYVCPTELYTSPAAQDGPFLNGSTYYFDLYPSSQQTPH